MNDTNGSEEQVSGGQVNDAQVSGENKPLSVRLAEDYSAVLKKCTELVATVLPDEDSRDPQACKLILDEVWFAYLQARGCGASNEDTWAHVATVTEALRQEFRGQEAKGDAEHEAQVGRIIAAFRKAGNEAGANSLQKKLDEFRAEREAKTRVEKDAPAPSPDPTP